MNPDKLSMIRSLPQRQRRCFAPVIFTALCCLLPCLLSFLPYSLVAAQDGSKLKPEELLARNLEALGSAEARAAVKNRVVSGSVKVVNQVGGTGSIEGQGMLVSAGSKFRFGMNFPSTDYTGEDLAFDGKRVTTGLLPQGKRSNLNLFLNGQDLILRDGLVGGALSTAWLLLRVDQQSLEYRGLKKVDGRQLHELLYKPRKGNADLRVTMYFDPENFRHVRTQYNFEVGARLGNGPNESARQQTSYYQLIETFDNFSVVDGLTLPHKYKMQLSVQSQRGALLSDWTFDINRISHKDPLDEQLFTIR